MLSRFVAVAMLAFIALPSVAAKHVLDNTELVCPLADRYAPACETSCPCPENMQHLKACDFCKFCEFKRLRTLCRFADSGRGGGMLRSAVENANKRLNIELPTDSLALASKIKAAEKEYVEWLKTNAPPKDEL